MEKQQSEANHQSFLLLFEMTERSDVSLCFVQQHNQYFFVVQVIKLHSNLRSKQSDLNMVSLLSAFFFIHYKRMLNSLCHILQVFRYVCMYLFC